MKDPDASIPSELLACYLAGEADEEQRRAVEEWVAASPENAAELEAMRTVWDLGTHAAHLSEVDVDRAWSRLDQRIAEEEGRGRIRSIRTGPHWMRWLSAAAVVAGIAFAARWFFQPSVVTYYAAATPVEVLLADSSRSVLSPGSTLEERRGEQRAMHLHGQAYFEVRRDEQRPFTVDVGDVLVTVLGTAFEVTAYDTSNYVEVRVRSGRVRVDAGGERIELGAGDHIRYHKQRHFLERRPAPPAEVWGIRILQFEGATLAQVAAQLERIYKVRITLHNDRIAACRLTAEFDHETINAILGVIAETFNLEVQAANDEFVLDGAGC